MISQKLTIIYYMKHLIQKRETYLIFSSRGRSLNYESLNYAMVSSIRRPSSVVRRQLF